jgi:ATP-dependent Clp protease adaptor protein ClpS
MAGKNDPKHDGQVLEREKPKVRKPRKWKVLIHNDDYTPMEFVVSVLQQIFHLGETDAIQVMLHVHNTGIGVAGVFAHAVAETKVAQTMQAAQRFEFPLQCTMEPEE